MPPSLEKLILGTVNGNSNKFAGGIPTEWSSLTNLKELNVADCGLDGAFVCRHPCAYVPFNIASSEMRSRAQGCCRSRSSA